MARLFNMLSSRTARARGGESAGIIYVGFFAVEISPLARESITI